MNATLGSFGVTLGLLAAVAGALTLASGLLRGSERQLRMGRRYAWVVLAGAVDEAMARGPEVPEYNLARGKWVRQIAAQALALARSGHRADHSGRYGETAPRFFLGGAFP